MGEICFDHLDKMTNMGGDKTEGELGKEKREIPVVQLVCGTIRLVVIMKIIIARVLFSEQSTF